MTRTRIATPPLILSATALCGFALLSVAAGCVLEPGQTRKETKRSLGLTAPPAATLRLTGTPGADGPARASCARSGHGEHSGFAISLRPASGDGPVVTAHLPEAGGEAHLTVLSPAGALSEGAGEGTLELTGTAGNHTAAGTITGRFAGAAGEGTLEVTFERCAFFG